MFSGNAVFKLTCSNLILAALLLPVCSLAEAPYPFFTPAPDLASQYDPDKIYPQGQVFPLTLYSVGGSNQQGTDIPLPEKEIQAALKRVKKDGFTMIGPQYELKDRIVADAKKHGLKCVYSVGLPMNFLGKGGRKTLQLSPEEIRKQIKQQILKVVKSPEIAWWNLKPEELRYWRSNEMDYLTVAAKAIHETDPVKRPICMYEPGHQDAKALVHTVGHIDICGKGMYTNYSGQRDSRIWVRWTIEQEIKAIKQANSSAIPIAIPEMFQQPPKELLDMIPKWVRHDVYLSLITGAKGIIVFSMRQRPNFDAHEAYYQAYAQCARELTGPLNLGQIFLFGQKRNNLQITVVDGPEKVVLNPKSKKPTEYSSVSFLDAAYRKERYLFVANSANQPVRVVVDGLPILQIRVESLFDADTFIVGERNFEVELDGLEVKAFRFKPQH